MRKVETITKVEDVNDLTQAMDTTDAYFELRADEEDQKDTSIFGLNDYLASNGGKSDIGDFTADPDGHDGHPGGYFPNTGNVYGHEGSDTWNHFGYGHSETFYGFAGDDDITAGYADDVVFGGIGNDEIDLNAGNDIGVGDEGDDLIIGMAGNDDLHAGEGADSLFGGRDDDRIFLEDDGDVDQIYFLLGDDNDVIDNFELGVDVMNLDAAFGFNSFAEIDALMSYNQAGDQAHLDLGGGDSIVFTNLDGALTEADFLF